MRRHLGALIKGLAKAISPEAKASQTGGLIAVTVQGRPQWTPRDYRSLAEQGYARNPIVYRCVRMISEAAASVPWQLTEAGRELDAHPLLDLLRRPNPRENGAAFLEALYGYLQVSGNAYLEAVEMDGTVRELYALRPDRMKVVPGRSGWAEAYEYEVDGRKIVFPMEARRHAPILHVALFHPSNDHYGMSPLEAAAVAVDVHNAGGAWNKALLDNAARPSGALIYKGPDAAPNLSAEQFERLKAELQENYEGARNAGRPLLLEGGLSWTQIGLTPADMDFIDAKHVAAREIALAFGVPPMLLGIPGDNTYANYREANLAFWRQTVLPLVAKTCQALTNWLAPRYGPDLRLRHDIERVSALSAERDALWSRVSRAQFLSLNEKRQAVGLEPVEGGESLGGQSQP